MVFALAPDSTITSGLATLLPAIPRETSVGSERALRTPVSRPVWSADGSTVRIGAGEWCQE
jgi:hypothetical protein